MLKHLLMAMAIVLSLAVFARGADRLVPSVYPTIQQAINAANNNDVVIIANGVYSGTGNREIDFLGKAINVHSVNGPGNCVVDCNYAGRGFYFHNNETSASVLEGIAIKNTSNYAVECSNSSPTISHCVITGYSGISCSGGSPAITGCTISGCYNSQGGVALNNCNGVNITNCTITNNYCYYYYGGGGINGSNSTASITGCIIKFNQAEAGGGISWQGGSATITNCEISNNNAHGRDGGPPDPMCPPGCMPGCDPIQMPGCIPCMPGMCPGPPPGDGRGGGICCWYNTSISLLNCLISGNQVRGGIGFPPEPGLGGAFGGGIYCDGTLNIYNSTICSNYATLGGMGCSGGGIQNDGTVTIESSIVWENHVESYQGSQIYGNADIIASDVGPEIWPGSMNLDPLFASGPLGDYYLSNVAAGQTGNSPCINTGSYLANMYGLDAFTTSTDNFPDLGQVDMGYHYEISEQPNLVLSDPNGGETFIAGKTHSVLWQSQGAVRDVRIEYSTDNGSYWQEVNPPNYGHTGSYQWLVPAVDSNHCLMRITDRNLSNATDTSNGTFTIFRCQLKGDLNGDCHVDFEDFAILSSEWLKCGNPFDPACQP